MSLFRHVQTEVLCGRTRNGRAGAPSPFCALTTERVVPPQNWKDKKKKKKKANALTNKTEKLKSQYIHSTEDAQRMLPTE